MTRGRYVVVYDQQGTVIAINPVVDNKLPVGVPYIDLHDYDPEHAEKCGVVISHVDVTCEPHQIIFKNTNEEAIIADMTLDEYKDMRQDQNKYSLDTFLGSHPVLWEDGHYYGVTQEDQSDMLYTKSLYDVGRYTNPEYRLRWRSVDAGYKDFTEDEFMRLMDKVIGYVYPYRQLEMFHKSRIYAATTKEEVAMVPIVYMDPIDENFLRA